MSLAIAVACLVGICAGWFARSSRDRERSARERRLLAGTRATEQKGV